MRKAHEEGYSYLEKRALIVTLNYIYCQTLIIATSLPHEMHSFV